MIEYQDYLIIVVYCVILIVLTEIFAYFWHRFIAHNDILLGIHEIHRIHHRADLYHEANEDFIWLQLILLSFIWMIIIFNNMINTYIKQLIISLTIIVPTMVLFWNWYIHKCYHTEDCWLNSYAWFRQERKRHMVHHKNIHKNYGIASHFCDKLFGTYIDKTPK